MTKYFLLKSQTWSLDTREKSNFFYYFVKTFFEDIKETLKDKTKGTLVHERELFCVLNKKSLHGLEL